MCNGEHHALHPPVRRPARPTMHRASMHASPDRSASCVLGREEPCDHRKCTRRELLGLLPVHLQATARGTAHKRHAWAHRQGGFLRQAGGGQRSGGRTGGRGCSTCQGRPGSASGSGRASSPSGSRCRRRRTCSGSAGTPRSSAPSPSAARPRPRAADPPLATARARRRSAAEPPQPRRRGASPTGSRVAPCGRPNACTACTGIFAKSRP